MGEYRKPLPSPNEVSAPFWTAAREHRLEIQRCRGCGAYQYYPRPRCATCWSGDIGFVRASGRGTVFSYTVARVPTHPGFAADVPYVIAIVELDEGVRMTTNIVGCDPAAVSVGMAVEVVFDDVTPEVTLVKFRPA